MATGTVNKKTASAESIEDKCPADIFRKALPNLTTPLGKEPNFTAVTDLLLGVGLITKTVLDGITSQLNLSDNQRGSKVAHKLLDKIEVSDDRVQCLLKICDVLEDGKVEDEQLRKHGDSMRSHLQANTDIVSIDQESSEIDAESISSASAGYYTDEELSRLCNCGGCSLEKIITEGCPANTGTASLHRFPLLDIKRLPAGKKQQYIYMIEKEGELINKAYSALYESISESMTSIDVLSMKRYVRNMKWFSKTTKETELRSRLDSCQDVGSILLVLTDVCSWFNHHPLESLVDQFGTNELKEKYCDFVNKILLPFLKRSITEIPKDGFGDVIEGSGQFQLKMDTNAAHENIRGDHIFFLKGSVAEALKISPENLHIISIREGCIEVIFMVPLAIYEVLFPLSDEHLQALLAIAVPIIEENSQLTVKSVDQCDTNDYRIKVVSVAGRSFDNSILTDQQEMFPDATHVSLDDDAPQQSWSKSQKKLPQKQSNSTSHAQSHVPISLKDEYMLMKSKFSQLLLHVVEEAFNKKSLESIKKSLLSLHPKMSKEVSKVDDKLKLMALLRNYCFLSNFAMLLHLTDTLQLDTKQELVMFTDERDKFFNKIPAKDFIQKVIEDHKMTDNQQEVKFMISYSSCTLAELQQIITKAFYSHRTFISLRAVHKSLRLTFVLCTIPDWIAGELITFVKDSKSLLESYGVLHVSIGMVNTTWTTTLGRQQVLTSDKMISLPTSNNWVDDHLVSIHYSNSDLCVLAVIGAIMGIFCCMCMYMYKYNVVPVATVDTTGTDLKPMAVVDDITMIVPFTTIAILLVLFLSFLFIHVCMTLRLRRTKILQRMKKIETPKKMNRYNYTFSTELTTQNEQIL